MAGLSAAPHLASLSEAPQARTPPACNVCPAALHMSQVAVLLPQRVDETLPSQQLEPLTALQLQARSTCTAPSVALPGSGNKISATLKGSIPLTVKLRIQ